MLQLQNLEQPTLIGALVVAVVALWRAYLSKAKVVETLLESQARLMAVVEKDLSQSQVDRRDLVERIEILLRRQQLIFGAVCGGPIQELPNTAGDSGTSRASLSDGR